jgi:hypothetical protein
VWEGGADADPLPSFSSRFLNLVAGALSNSAGAAERVAVIRQTMPTVQQLLPIFDYIAGRHYPDGYPQNAFLEQLDRPDQQDLLRQRVAYSVVGSQTHPTLSSLTVESLDPAADLWPEGLVVDQTKAAGDGEVLAASLQWLGAADAWLDTDHSGLVTAASSFVERTLLGASITDDDQEDLTPEPNPPIGVGGGAPAASASVVIAAGGPVALRLTDSAGRVVDDGQIDVPGAYYSGSTETPQLLSAPLETGSYTLTVIGLGTGSYQIQALTTDGSLTDPQAGSLVAGQQIQYFYDAQTQQLTPSSVESTALASPTPNAPPVTSPLSGAVGSLPSPVAVRQLAIAPQRWPPSDELPPTGSGAVLLTIFILLVILGAGCFWRRRWRVPRL